MLEIFKKSAGVYRPVLGEVAPNAGLLKLAPNAGAEETPNPVELGPNDDVDVPPNGAALVPNAGAALPPNAVGAEPKELPPNAGV